MSNPSVCLSVCLSVLYILWLELLTHNPKLSPDTYRAICLKLITKMTCVCYYIFSVSLRVFSQTRPTQPLNGPYFTIIQGSHSHGKSWKKQWSWKVMENSKNSECHGNLFARKKSHGKVMEISCPNPPNRVPIVLWSMWI